MIATEHCGGEFTLLDNDDPSPPHRGDVQTAAWHLAAARLGYPPDLLGYAFQLYAAAGWTSIPWSTA